MYSSYSLNRKSLRLKQYDHNNFSKKIVYKTKDFKLFLTPLLNPKSKSGLIISVPKKNVSRSVDRHKLKRCVFEFFRVNTSWKGNYHVFIKYNSKNIFDKENISFKKISSQILTSCPALL